MKGLFITIEGTDGVGKSTQIALLVDYLKKKGLEVVLTREPGGTAIGEKIRDILLDAENKKMTAETEAFLYAASRAQHVDEVILPALEQGKVVVCDRFIDSSFAYQGFARGIGVDFVENINKHAVAKCMPDITFFFNLEPEKGIFRKEASKTLDRIENEKMDFHCNVYNGYKELLKKYPERIKRIYAGRSVDDVHKQVVEIISRIL